MLKCCCFALKTIVVLIVIVEHHLNALKFFELLLESVQLFVFVAQGDKEHLVFLDHCVTSGASLFQGGAK